MVEPNRKRHARRGSALILLTLLMVFLIALVAFGYEIGRVYLVRSQLQSAVDAGALAASIQLRLDDDVETAEEAAQEFVQLNSVGWNVTVPEESIDIQSGRWDPDSRTFTEDEDDPNSIRVFARQVDEPFLFGTVLGRNSFDVPRFAIAAAQGGPSDIAMVLDLSSSMLSEGRIQALWNAAPVFVDVIEEFAEEDQIAVMGYGIEPDEFTPSQHGYGTPYRLAPLSLYPPDSSWVGVVEAELTDNFDSLRNNVLTSANLQGNKYGGGTPIGASIRDGVHYLTSTPLGREDIGKVVLLMSDGRANEPSGNGPGYARAMANYAASNKVRVYTVSLGNSADVDLMEDIATVTGGKHFDARGTGASTLSARLTAAFRNAALSMKRATLVQ